MYITLQEKKKRIKSNMTIGDNLTIFRHHMPLNIKENMIVHLKRRRKIGFGYCVASHALSKWCKRHSLANIFLSQPRIFLTKKIINNVKIPKFLSITLIITLNTIIKIQKYLQMKNLFLLPRF
jgi:hypothetical protein